MLCVFLLTYGTLSLTIASLEDEIAAVFKPENKQYIVKNLDNAISNVKIVLRDIRVSYIGTREANKNEHSF